MMENRSFDEYFGTFPGAAGFYDGSPSMAQPWLSQPGGVLYPWRMSTFTTNALATPGLGHDWITNHVAINVDPASGSPDNANFYTSSDYKAVAMGCYVADDIPYQWALAQSFALCDHYFCSVLAGTASNRLYLVGGTITDPAQALPASGIYSGSESDSANTGPETNYNGTDPILYNFGSQAAPEAFGAANVPVIPWVTNLAHWQSYLADLWKSSAGQPPYRVYDDWNWQFGWATSQPRLAGVSDLNVFTYYEPYQAASGQITLGTPDDPNYFAANYTPNAAGAPGDDRPLFAQHINPTDAQQQAPFLAPLTWILPPWNYSEHPTFTSADGAYYVAQIVDALMASEFWESTVLVITYDETDVHFDHMPPPLSPDPRQVLAGLQPSPYEPWVEDASGTSDDGYAINYPAPVGAGLRVPTIIVSPWTYQRGIVSDQLDHTSILQLMETVSNVNCSALPAADSDLGWRRANFADLYQVIDPENFLATPAQQITGLPSAATVCQWRANANAREQRQHGDGPVPPAPQTGPAVPQACTLTLNPASIDSTTALSHSGSFPDAITVIVTGFQAQEFIEPNAGIPPPLATANLPEVPAPGGPCYTRVPMLQVMSGASPGEIVIGNCTQVSADPGAMAPAEEPQLAFSFPLTFTDPAVSFAFRSGTVRLLGVQASFSVETTLTADAQLTLTGGTLVVHQLGNACQRLAEQLAGAEAALLEAQRTASGSAESAAELHALELALGELQDLYQRECGSGGTSGPPGPFQIGGSTGG
jgi:phospholipase C